MSGKHDRSLDDEQSTRLMMTGPIAIRGLGRSVKDAFRPGKPSRHRAFVAHGEDEGVDAMESASTRDGEPMTQQEPTEAASSLQAEESTRTESPDRSREDSVADLHPDDETPTGSDVERGPDEDAQDEPGTEAGPQLIHDAQPRAVADTVDTEDSADVEGDDDAAVDDAAEEDLEGAVDDETGDEVEPEVTADDRASDAGDGEFDAAEPEGDSAADEPLVALEPDADGPRPDAEVTVDADTDVVEGDPQGRPVADSDALESDGPEDADASAAPQIEETADGMRSAEAGEPWDEGTDELDAVSDEPGGEQTVVGPSVDDEDRANTESLDEFDALPSPTVDAADETGVDVPDSGPETAESLEDEFDALPPSAAVPPVEFDADVALEDDAADSFDDGLKPQASENPAVDSDSDAVDPVDGERHEDGSEDAIHQDIVEAGAPEDRDPSDQYSAPDGAQQDSLDAGPLVEDADSIEHASDTEQSAEERVEVTSAAEATTEPEEEPTASDESDDEQTGSNRTDDDPALAEFLGARGWTTAEELYSRPIAVQSADEAETDLPEADEPGAENFDADQLEAEDPEAVEREEDELETVEAQPDGEEPAPDQLAAEAAVVDEPVEPQMFDVLDDAKSNEPEPEQGSAVPTAVAAGAATTAAEPAGRASVSSGRPPHGPRSPARRSRPMRDRFSREAIGIAVLVVLALVCGGLITAVVIKTQRDAALAAQEAADYTPPPLATPTPVATGASVAVIGDGATTTAASGVTAAQRWSALVGTSLDGTVDIDASAGMGYAAKGASGETFVQAAAEVPSNADVVVFFGGAEDSDVATLSLAKAATDALAAARERASDATLIVVGPAIRAGVSEADLTSVRNTLRTAARIAKATWIDPIDDGWLSDAKQASASPTALSEADEKTIASKMESAIKKATS